MLLPFYTCMYSNCFAMFKVRLNICYCLFIHVCTAIVLLCLKLG